MHCCLRKIHEDWLERDNKVQAIKKYLNIGLFYPNKFHNSLFFFGHMKQKTVSNRLFFYETMLNTTIFL